MSMFCYQCEQTAQGTGCTVMGICGKSPETTVLQDLMIYQLKGISQYAHRTRQLGEVDKQVDYTTLKSLFATLTNVNFDEAEHYEMIRHLGIIAEKSKSLYEAACAKAATQPKQFQGPASWRPAGSNQDIASFAQTVSLLKKLESGDKTIIGLQELLTYGIKGLAAYAHHADVLGYKDDRTCAFVYEALDYLTKPEQSEDQLLTLCLRAGEANYLVMELLDKAHTETFGHPEPTKVRITTVKGKCILVSGHDLRALNELLKQTAGKGINVYTHGELLPALAYPELKKYPHLIGNYGGAWQNQVAEFAAFPGSILMTTNCIKPPADSYRDRIFTLDAVGFSGLTKIGINYDFSHVIAAAMGNDGFLTTEPDQYIEIGYGHNAVLGVADAVINAVKQGDIRHFFLVGGCDGAEYSRNYYTDLAEQIPSDCVIMTLGCAKYRFNKEDFGTTGGIPRLLDLGQCNDSYSAIKIASALAQAFNCGINDLPLSLILSWLEQKAVAVLLTLLHLGVKNIRLGPSLPAFVTPEVLEKLTTVYGLRPITTPNRDLAEIQTVSHN